MQTAVRSEIKVISRASINILNTNLPQNSKSKRGAASHKGANMSYIISRSDGNKKEYLLRLTAGVEEWQPTPIGAKSYPSEQSARIVCDIIRRRKDKKYEVERI